VELDHVVIEVAGSVFMAPGVEDGTTNPTQLCLAIFVAAALLHRLKWSNEGRRRQLEPSHPFKLVEFARGTQIEVMAWQAQPAFIPALPLVTFQVRSEVLIHWVVWYVSRMYASSPPRPGTRSALDTTMVTANDVFHLVAAAVLLSVRADPAFAEASFPPPQLSI